MKNVREKISIGELKKIKGGFSTKAFFNATSLEDKNASVCIFGCNANCKPGCPGGCQSASMCSLED
jgi:hypothetical protein